MGRWACLLEAAGQHMPRGKVGAGGQGCNGMLTGNNKLSADKRKTYGQVGDDWVCK